MILVGDSPPMRTLKARIERVASTPLPVLLTGETGTGKEIVARVVHERSGRRGPFVARRSLLVAYGLWLVALPGELWALASPPVPSAALMAELRAEIGRTGREFAVPARPYTFDS